jgi:hypothetical protein
VGWHKACAWGLGIARQLRPCEEQDGAFQGTIPFSINVSGNIAGAYIDAAGLNHNYGAHNPDTFSNGARASSFA